MILPVVSSLTNGTRGSPWVDRLLHVKSSISFGEESMISEKFYGSFNELRKTIELSGLKGKWSREAEKEVFRVQGHKRGVINWYPTTNTLFFQGKYEVVAYNYRHFRAALINSLRQ